MRLSPSDPDLQTIVSRINAGDIDLQPEFQRGEVWPVSKKTRLIDSILRNWHIPPIHVVVTKSGMQEVLDGQQRLISIRDFVQGEFSVNGKIEPFDPAILALDGFLYTDLPVDARRAFDRFTIRVFLLTDYSPQEPGELFFRLNQMTYLTAAEQRNAFFGEVRQQVRDIVSEFEYQEGERLVGFSNKRMALDDVIAKLLCSFERETISIKLTASDISNRFRKSNGFSYSVVGRVRFSLEMLRRIFFSVSGEIKFNKATLFSWLVFLQYFDDDTKFDEGTLKRFSIDFLFGRGPEFAVSDSINSPLTKYININHAIILLQVFSDRSSSRVSDTSSVLLRDLILWIFYAETVGLDAVARLLSTRRLSIISEILETIRNQREHVSLIESKLESHPRFSEWGNLG